MRHRQTVNSASSPRLVLTPHRLLLLLTALFAAFASGEPQQLQDTSLAELCDSDDSTELLTAAASAKLAEPRLAAAAAPVDITDNWWTYGYCCRAGDGRQLQPLRCEVRFKLAFFLLCGLGGVGLLAAACTGVVAALQRWRRHWDALDEFLSRPLIQRRSGLSVRSDSDLLMPELPA